MTHRGLWGVPIGKIEGISEGQRFAGLVPGGPAFRMQPLWALLPRALEVSDAKLRTLYTRRKIGDRRVSRADPAISIRRELPVDREMRRSSGANATQ